MNIRTVWRVLPTSTVEIDGPGHDVLHRALVAGDAPNLAAWLRRGSHRLSS
jgi:hypothetical protein